MAFGLTDAMWGVRKAMKGRRHEHVHVHADTDTVHKHPHDHAGAHAHPHGETASVTTWWLFVVFVLGPCEALIPLLAAPAADHDVAAGVLVALVFGGTTLATMLALVAAGYAGLRVVSVKPLERWSHALAGTAVVVSGVAIQALGI